MRSRYRSRAAAVATTVAITAALLVAMSAAPATATTHNVQKTVYAAPDTTNTANCATSTTPCSLVGARNYVRGLTGTRTGDVVVQLAGGLYELPATFALTAADSGRDGYDVIYRAALGAKPILSGGTTIAGTTFVQDGTTGVYYAPNVTVESRQLYVNGVRATRARGPEIPGEYKPVIGGYPISTTVPYNAMPSWGNQGDIELVGHFNWKRSRYSVKNVTSSLVVMDDQGVYDGNVHFAANKSRVYFENARELLDQPGEWYLDRATDRLYYKPADSATLAGSTFVLGTTHQLLTGTGTDAAPLHNMQFDGLTFTYDGWTEPNTEKGYPDLQAGNVIRSAGNADRAGKDWKDLNYQTPAGVSFTHAHNIVVRNSTFEHMANAALAFGTGTHDSLIYGNTVTDISGNGINVGGILKTDHAAPADKMVRNIVVANNTISKVGAEYLDNAGIFVGYTRNTTVTHNTVIDVPYTGISVGWGWGEIDYLQPTFAVGNNIVSYNKVHDVVMAAHDGGGIYTLGAQPGSKLTGNYVARDMKEYGYLYHDNGSEGWYDSKNVIDGTDGGTTTWLYTNTDYNPTYDPDQTKPWFATHNNTGANNWVTSGMVTRKVVETNSTSGTVVVSNNNWPAEALAIMAAAGAHTPISVGRPAVASSEYVSPTGEYAAGKAVDGNFRTRWAQVFLGADPSSLTVDLGSARLVTGVLTDVHLHYGGPVKYKIDYATVQNAWQPYADHTATAAIPGFDQPGAAVTARWVRITFTDTKTVVNGSVLPQGGSINEFTVFG